MSSPRKKNSEDFQHQPQSIDVFLGRASIRFDILGELIVRIIQTNSVQDQIVCFY